jgi:hypothetical protein
MKAVQSAERRPSSSDGRVHADAGCTGMHAGAEMRRFAAGGCAADFHDGLYGSAVLPYPVWASRSFRRSMTSTGPGSTARSSAA